MTQRYSYRHVEGPENTDNYYQVIDLILNDLIGPKFKYKTELERAKALNGVKQTLRDIEPEYKG